MRRTFFGRIQEFFTTASNSISRSLRIQTTRLSRSFHRPTVDWGRPDYDFWRKAHYGKAKGLEISGLFIKPLTNKIAGWALGRPPLWKLESEEAGEELSKWWSENHTTILKAYRASIRQGDAYLIVNPDLSISTVPPETVDPIVDEADMSKQIGWKVTQVFTHPENVSLKMTMIDEYRADRRIRTVETNGIQTSREEYPNLLGTLPIIHIANNLDDGETFGHPEAEGLVNVLHRYGSVLEAAIEGNELQGRPTPVMSFDTANDMDTFWDKYGETETQELPDGTTETSTFISVDLQQLLTISGAKFSYESPGSFVSDTEKLLGLMFYMILEHTELPEFVFGNAVSSSKASAETQMPVFIRFIEMKQGEASGWLRELADVVLAFMRLVNPSIPAEKPILQWEQLSETENKLTLESVKWAYAENLIDKKTALMLAPVDIEDIQAVIDSAEEEREAEFPENGEPRETDQLALFRAEVNKLEAENGN